MRQKTITAAHPRRTGAWAVRAKRTIWPKVTWIG